MQNAFSGVIGNTGVGITAPELEKTASMQTCANGAHQSYNQLVLCLVPRSLQSCSDAMVRSDILRLRKWTTRIPLAQLVMQGKPYECDCCRFCLHFGSTVCKLGLYLQRMVVQHALILSIFV